MHYTNLHQHWQWQGHTVFPAATKPELNRCIIYLIFQMNRMSQKPNHVFRRFWNGEQCLAEISSTHKLIGRWRRPEIQIQTRPCDVVLSTLKNIKLTYNILLLFSYYVHSQIASTLVKIHSSKQTCKQGQTGSTNQPRLTKTGPISIQQCHN